MNPLQDAFISYGRIDSKEFAKRLNSRLIRLGYTAWFDVDDIPLGVDYQKQIDDGIEKADNFIYIISPRSVNSPYCDLELELALKYKKRIIPLLHVEEISRDTWQQRNPEGTDGEWDAYQQKGQHISSQNMSPEIRKINWIYLREDVDDFEQSFQGLIDLLERDKAYVHQHTILLTAALEWERNQRQTRYLRIGEELQQAETWLAVRFEDSQPPVLPTDFHYEYITESIKNGNHLMTEVFLSHAEEDRPISDKISRTLMRAGITTWTNHSDIEAGTEDFFVSLSRGVEEADNLVFLMSVYSLQSDYCQKELELALSLNKRIVIVLAGLVDASKIPESLKNQQYIDLTDNQTDADYLNDENDLLRTLKQDASYYHDHKILLTKALKWKRQDYNPCILLQGYGLQYALAWRDIAQVKDSHSLTSIQDQFIETSKNQTSAILPDVFISYSAADADFARRLNNALQQQRRRTWFDQENIASGADFQQEIRQGIEKSNYFLFILSPRSVRSPYCADEVEYAVKLNKRVVTILYCPVEVAELHPELAKVQWIDFNAHGGEFATNFRELLRTLDTDAEYLKYHTRLLMRAKEWVNKRRQDDFLLRGEDLKEAEQWRRKAIENEPKPTPLQEEYIATSGKLFKSRRTTLIAAVGALTLLSLASGIAIRQSVVAHRIRILAEHQARNTELRSEAITVENLKSSGLNHQALWVAMGLGRDIKRYDKSGYLEPGTKFQAISVLREVYHDEQGFLVDNTITGHDAAVTSVTFSPDGTTLASASADGTVKLWNAISGELFHILIGHEAPISSISFSPDGSLLASVSEDGMVKLWQTSSGAIVNTLSAHQAGVSIVSFLADGNTLVSASEDGVVKLSISTGSKALQPLQGRAEEIYNISFSSDGTTLAAGGNDGMVRLWDPRSGREIQTLAGQDAPILKIKFSPDGNLLATVDTFDTVRLWNRNSGEVFQTLKGYGNVINNISFSPDATVLASANGDGMVKLWDLRSGKELQTLKGHSDSVSNVSFSPDGNTLVSASDDGILKVWKRNHGGDLQILSGHGKPVSSLSFSPNNNLLASADFDGTVKLWDSDNSQELQTLVGHVAPVWSIQFSSDGSLLASASADQTVKVWNPEDGSKLQTLTGHEAPVWSVSFSPDDTLVASASADRTIKLWDVSSGDELITLIGHQDWVNSLSFSPDGSLLASASDDGTVKLWDLRSGKEIKTLLGHGAPVWSVSFSPVRSGLLRDLGYVLASAGADSTVKLWDSVSGQELETLAGHSSLVTSVGFSPDGKILASAGADHTVQLWDITGQQQRRRVRERRDRRLYGRKPGLQKSSSDNLHSRKLQTLDDHTDRVTSVSFAPDGSVLASASDDGTVIIWDFSLDVLMAKACSSQQRYLLHGNPTDEQLEVCEGSVASQPQKSS